MAEQEHDRLIDEDILTDHEYDGIQEYDNPLPGWWVYLFWATIIFCVPYVIWYHIGIGPSVHDKYEAELTSYAEAQLAKFGELEPSEATILEYVENDNAMIAMQGLFKTNCAKCHLSDGSGQVGPNLTDAYWKNADGVMGIYNVINEGLPLKGMPSWQGKLLDTQMVLLSSYVTRMGRNPIPPAAGGKAPEGNLVEPWPPPTPAPAAEEGSAESTGEAS
jgi:cytochrome c oxidase cbb3-type subunit 3